MVEMTAILMYNWYGGFFFCKYFKKQKEAEGKWIGVV